MNILLINHYAGSDYHGMEFRPYYMGREWKSQRKYPWFSRKKGGKIDEIMGAKIGKLI